MGAGGRDGLIMSADARIVRGLSCQDLLRIRGSFALVPRSNLRFVDEIQGTASFRYFACLLCASLPGIGLDLIRRGNEVGFAFR